MPIAPDDSISSDTAGGNVPVRFPNVGDVLPASLGLRSYPRYRDHLWNLPPAGGCGVSGVIDAPSPGLDDFGWHLAGEPAGAGNRGAMRLNNYYGTPRRPLGINLRDSKTCELLFVGPLTGGLTCIAVASRKTPRRHDSSSAYPDNLKTQSKLPNTAPNNLISGCRFATQVQIDPLPALSRVRFAAGEGAHFDFADFCDGLYPRAACVWHPSKTANDSCRGMLSTSSGRKTTWMVENRKAPRRHDSSSAYPCSFRMGRGFYNRTDAFLTTGQEELIN